MARALAPSVDQQVLAQIREYLLTPPDDEYGVFASYQPYSIARVLTGDPAWFVIHPQARGAAPYFEALGRRLASFYRDFRARREQSGRKKGAREPRADELGAAFGPDARLIAEAWSLAAYVDAVLAIRGREDLAPDERQREEDALWDEAKTVATAARPTKLVFHPPSVAAGGDPELGEGLTGRVRAIVSRVGAKRGWDRHVVEDVTQKVLTAFPEGVVRRRLLAARPGEGGQGVFERTMAFIASYAKDKAPPRVKVVLGDADAPPRPVPASTLRGLFHRDEIERDADRTQIAKALERSSARRAHRDPDGKTVTGTELAVRWGRSPRTVNAIIAKASPILGPFERNGKSKGWRVPDREEITGALRNMLPGARAPRRARASEVRCSEMGPDSSRSPRFTTVATVAEDCGVSLATARRACRKFQRYSEEGAPWGMPDAKGFAETPLSEDEAELLAGIIERYAEPTT